MWKRAGGLLERNVSRSWVAPCRSVRMNSTEKEKVVILGTGWSSFRMVQSLSDKYKIVVVSPRNHFLFTPLLPSTTTGTLEFRSIVEPIRTSKIMDHVTYYQAHCTSFEPEKNLIHCESEYTGTFEVDYDKLVVGVGARNNTFGIEGVEENAHFLKELQDARSIRAHLLQNFEKAIIPTISKHERSRILSCVIVGGGPTGVEYAAELCDFLWNDLPRAYPQINAHEVKVTLLEAGPNILSAFDASMVKKALTSLRKRGVDIRTDSAVSKVNPESLELDSGYKIPYGTLVWSTGVGPHEVVSKSPFKTERGRIVTDEYLKVLGTENVFAFGDCASPESGLLPATAQVALQQGKYLARSLNRMQQNKELQEFKYHFLGNMAYIGGNKSLLESEYVNLSGWVSWIAWRAAYFTRLGSWVNKIQVPFDWTKTLIFGRDVTIF
uniref:FAD/NAD(P)-binding domain-containing protein n=1 Tax=Vannella robusta TaxID=1487602 RepID=A0A7S4I0K7_9EUKA|mmetsp:Transcript_18711/g.23715  ORF Transcript_18711/g.23715 Transcript_18711/m.23715 type:complete len:438 (+) Transcript_18711:203-1516(+)